jgi:hypothetical protein
VLIPWVASQTASIPKIISGRVRIEWSLGQDSVFPGRRDDLLNSLKSLVWIFLETAQNDGIHLYLPPLSVPLGKCKFYAPKLLELAVKFAFSAVWRISAFGDESPLLPMPELYRRLSGDVNRLRRFFA